jgi:hypothetical protein
LTAGTGALDMPALAPSAPHSHCRGRVRVKVRIKVKVRVRIRVRFRVRVRVGVRVRVRTIAKMSHTKPMPGPNSLRRSCAH